MIDIEILTNLTKELGRYHAEKKTGTDGLKEKRDEFFEKATEDVDENALATKTVESPEKSKVDPDEWVKTYYPGWEILKADLGDNKIILREDPKLKKYVFVNSEDNQVYTRNAIEGDHYLDNERLEEDHPEIMARILAPSPPDPVASLLIKQMAKDLLGDPKVGEEWLEYWMNFEEWPKQINLEDANEDDLAIIADYMIPGAISLRMEVREAKPEEIDGTDND